MSTLGRRRQMRFSDRFAAAKLDTKIARSQAEVDWLLDEALHGSVPPGSQTLDDGCGRGRTVIALARRGLTASGIDINLQYIHEARSRALQHSLSCAFYHADSRTFAPDKSFDIVTSMFSSFGYYSDEENIAQIHRWSRWLNPGGHLLMEVQNGGNPEVVQRERVETEVSPDGAKLVKNSTFDAARNRKNFRFCYVEEGKPASFETFSLRIYTSDELSDLLTASGFTVIRTFGNSRGQSFDCHDSEKIVVLARKEP
jgi:cyclopropane fatty-acyl-phospholipid synthase-like methyltransferase